MIIRYNIFYYVLSNLFYCPAGTYCGSDGLPEPSGDCAPGWYCSGGAFSSKPSPIVNGTAGYSVADCPIYSHNYTGGICTPGNTNTRRGNDIVLMLAHHL